jgi:hypothetical protein
MDFSHLLDAFSREGMDYPATWDSSDLASVEMILQEEMGKAHSMFGMTFTKVSGSGYISPDLS